MSHKYLVANRALLSHSIRRSCNIPGVTASHICNCSGYNPERSTSEILRKFNDVRLISYQILNEQDSQRISSLRKCLSTNWIYSLKWAFEPYSLAQVPCVKMNMDLSHCVNKKFGEQEYLIQYIDYFFPRYNIFLYLVKARVIRRMRSNLCLTLTCWANFDISGGKTKRKKYN